MAHVSDFSQLPQDIIIALVNGSQPEATALTKELVQFGLPTAAVGADPERNTELELTAVEGSGYAGSRVVQYNRLAIQGFVKPAAFPDGLRLPVGNATLFSELIGEINAALNLNIQPGDYVDGEIGTWQGVPNETKNISITMSADSLLFLGSLSLTLFAEDIPLNEVITQPVLDGLNYPE